MGGDNMSSMFAAGMRVAVRLRSLSFAMVIVPVTGFRRRGRCEGDRRGAREEN